MKKFTTMLTNAVEAAAPASVWGKKNLGKGGSTTNAEIMEKKNTSEKENV